MADLEIDYKSTGTLINELITTELKIKNIGDRNEFLTRRVALGNAISNRYSFTNLKMQIGEDWNRLAKVCDSLWWEQEVLYKFREVAPKTYEEFKDCAQAGINSIILNGERSRLVRRIDQALNEESSMPLEKSFR